MGVRIACGAERRLINCHLDKESEQKVRSCIFNYGRSNGKLLDKIQYLFFIVIECVKGVFNKSSWQESCRILKKQFTDFKRNCYSDDFIEKYLELMIKYHICKVETYDPQRTYQEVILEKELQQLVLLHFPKSYEVCTHVSSRFD